MAPTQPSAQVQLTAAAQQLAAHPRQDSRRVRQRLPTARRSLLNCFDAALSTEDSEDGLDESEESDCEMLGSQGSEQCSYASFAPLPSPGLASPSTPLQEDEVYAVPSPGSQDDCGSPASSPSPGGLPLPADSLGEHMLPLQHLLMSERAQHLSALEVKAIVYKVAADLGTLHDAGVLHRHVTVASVALSRSGNLATARLMGHPYNVDASQGRRYTGAKKPGVDAYLAPELARCPLDCVAYTPAGDMWSLGVVLFVLLSGSHVPFGNRGLCWTSIPNMPGPQESVDKLQRWIEEHLVCKLGVINQLQQSQEKGKAPVGAGPEMRVVGLDDAACDLLLRLLAADPAARPTARQVLRHPWLTEVQGFMPSTRLDASPGAQAPATTTPSPVHAGSQGFEANLTRTASEMARLGFQPTADREEQAQRLSWSLAHSSSLPMSSNDFHATKDQFNSEACLTTRSSAHESTACLAELMPAGAAGRAGSAMLTGHADIAQHRRPPAAGSQQAGLVVQEPPAFNTSHSFVLADGTALQLLPPQTVAVLVASRILPDPGSASAGLPYRALGFAVQPVSVEVEGQQMQLSALHAVLDVDGNPMLCAQPVAVTQQLPSACTHQTAAAAPSLVAASAAGSAQNPDLATSAPILPLLARMLQQDANAAF